MHLNDVFSVSFHESGGKLVHTFCFLRSYVIQLILTRLFWAFIVIHKPSFELLFLFFLFFFSWFSKYYFCSWPCAPPHTLASSYHSILPHFGLFVFFSSHVRHPHAHLCEFRNAFCIPVRSLPEFVNEASRIEKWLLSSYTHILQSEGLKSSFWEADLCVATMQKCMDIR